MKCPHCGQEYTMQVRDGSAIYCTHCGYEQISDEYGFLHNQKGVGQELRYVSDWSRKIFEDLKKQVTEGLFESLSTGTKILMIDYQKHKFREVGQGTVTLNKGNFCIKGILSGEPVELNVSTDGLPTLPFSPGKYFEIQDGKNIYRCVLDDGRLVMKFINLVKIFYQLKHPAAVPTK